MRPFAYATPHRIDDAIDTYHAALEVYPDHIHTLQALARCQLYHRREDDRTDGHLREIAFRGHTEQWRTWARTRLALRPTASEHTSK